MRYRTPILGLLVVGLATGTVDVREESLQPATFSASAIFKRSLDTMAAVRSVYSTGRYSEREVEIGDLSSAGTWRIQGKCVEQGSATISQFSYRGKQIGRHPKSADEEYIVRATRYEANPSLWWRHWTVWVRAARPVGNWHRTGVTHDAEIVSLMCSSLLVPQLRLHLPRPIEDLGRATIDGRSTIHLQSSFDGAGSGATDDLYIDPMTFRWVRVALSGWGAGCCHAFSATFDFSQYNMVRRVGLPRPAVGSMSGRPICPQGRQFDSSSRRDRRVFQHARTIIGS